MKTFAYSIASCLFTMILTQGCTDAIAPEASGTKSGENDSSGNAKAAKPSTTSESGATSADTAGGTATGGTSASGTGATSSTGGAASGSGSAATSAPANLGKASAEGGDLAISGKIKNVYGMINDLSGTKSFMIVATDGGAPDFRKIKEYGDCKACVGDECKASTTEVKTLSITLMSLGGTGSIDADGFPNAETYQKTSSAAYTVSLSYSEGSDTSKLLSGGLASGDILDFTTKPTATVAKATDPDGTAGSKFVVKVNSGFFPAMSAPADYSAPAKTYQVTLEGHMYLMPTQPTAPTCEAGKYAPVKSYEDDLAD